jgi:hypothetical protein
LRLLRDGTPRLQGLKPLTVCWLFVAAKAATYKDCRDRFVGTHFVRREMLRSG